MLIRRCRFGAKAIDCHRIGFIGQQIGKRNTPDQWQAAKIGGDRRAVESVAQIDHRNRGADHRRRHTGAPQLGEHNLAGTAKDD